MIDIWHCNQSHIMKTKQILSLMQIISWVIFIGLCIKAGALLISSFVSLFINVEATKDLYLGLDLSTIYEYDWRYYTAIISLIISMAIIKSYIFYLVIKIFPKINLEHPFHPSVAAVISKISHLALGVGVIALIGESYSKWLMHREVTFQFEWGASEFFFVAALIFVIGLIFKRGIEIQAENELTV